MKSSQSNQPLKLEIFYSLEIQTCWILDRLNSNSLNPTHITPTLHSRNTPNQTYSPITQHYIWVTCLPYSHASRLCRPQQRRTGSKVADPFQVCLWWTANVRWESLVSPLIAPHSFGLGSVLEAHVHGADQRALLLHRVPADVPPQADRDHQPLGEVGAEQQVDAGVGAAVQAGQQHQDGEGGGWRGQRTEARDG